MCFDCKSHANNNSQALFSTFFILFFHHYIVAYTKSFRHFFVVISAKTKQPIYLTRNWNFISWEQRWNWKNYAGFSQFQKVMETNYRGFFETDSEFFLFKWPLGNFLWNIFLYLILGKLSCYVFNRRLHRHLRQILQWNCENRFSYGWIVQYFFQPWQK